MCMLSFNRTVHFNSSACQGLCLEIQYFQNFLQFSYQLTMFYTNIIYFPRGAFPPFLSTPPPFFFPIWMSSYCFSLCIYWNVILYKNGSLISLPYLTISFFQYSIVLRSHTLWLIKTWHLWYTHYNFLNIIMEHLIAALFVWWTNSIFLS